MQKARIFFDHDPVLLGFVAPEVIREILLVLDEVVFREFASPVGELDGFGKELLDALARDPEEGGVFEGFDGDGGESGVGFAEVGSDGVAFKGEQEVYFPPVTGGVGAYGTFFNEVGIGIFLPFTEDDLFFGKGNGFYVFCEQTDSLSGQLVCFLCFLDEFHVGNGVDNGVKLAFILRS